MGPKIPFLPFHLARFPPRVFTAPGFPVDPFLLMKRPISVRSRHGRGGENETGGDGDSQKSQNRFFHGSFSWCFFESKDVCRREKVYTLKAEKGFAILLVFILH